MTEARILIACVGNIFRGDDGFGVEVARKMAQHPMPAGVALKDFGIRGFDLTYALLDPRELTILVDACPRGGVPGTVYVIEPDLAAAPPIEAATVETHGMDPMRVLAMAQSMGGIGSRVLVVGCEPEDLGTEEEGRLGLTEIVQAAVDDAVAAIQKVIYETREKEPVEAELQAN